MTSTGKQFGYSMLFGTSSRFDYVLLDPDTHATNEAYAFKFDSFVPDYINNEKESVLHYLLNLINPKLYKYGITSSRKYLCMLNNQDDSQVLELNMLRLQWFHFDEEKCDMFYTYTIHPEMAKIVQKYRIVSSIGITKHHYTFKHE